MGLDPVGAADHQHGAVQYLQRPLHFGGEIHVARGVQQGDLPVRPGSAVRQRKHRLFGKNGDAPLPLQVLRIQEGVPVVHPAQGTDGARPI